MRIIQMILSYKFDLKPRNREDYYTVGRLMIGKRIAFCAVGLTIFLSILLMLLISPKREDGNQYKTYRYNSIGLKFAKDQVIILGKSGYQAYKGEVDKGVVTGKGVLYRSDQTIVYEGEFLRNQFEGTGIEFYENSNIKYEGGFSQNVYKGEGTLYRPDGTMEYEGEFFAGLKEGKGKLYDQSEKLIYNGSFQKDRLLYMELLGKTAAQAAEVYTGKETIYETEHEYCLYMEDIHALYKSENAQDTLEGEWTVDGIYVLEDSIFIDGIHIERISQLNEILGECSYEGNTVVSISDAVAINEAVKSKEILYGAVEMDMREVFSDVIQVDAIEKNYTVYLYQYRRDGLMYTFFASKKNKGFDMYLIEKL